MVVSRTFGADAIRRPSLGRTVISVSLVVVALVGIGSRFPSYSATSEVPDPTPATAAAPTPASASAAETARRAEPEEDVADTTERRPPLELVTDGGFFPSAPESSAKALVAPNESSSEWLVVGDELYQGTRTAAVWRTSARSLDELERMEVEDAEGASMTAVAVSGSDAVAVGWQRSPSGGSGRLWYRDGDRWVRSQSLPDDQGIVRLTGVEIIDRPEGAFTGASPSLLVWGDQVADERSGYRPIVLGLTDDGWREYVVELGAHAEVTIVAALSTGNGLILVGGGLLADESRSEGLLWRLSGTAFALGELPAASTGDRSITIEDAAELDIPARGGRLVVVGSVEAVAGSGTFRPRVWLSDDSGQTWTSTDPEVDRTADGRFSPVAGGFGLVASGGSALVASSTNGWIQDVWRSNDGEKWSLVGSIRRESDDEAVTLEGLALSRQGVAVALEDGELPLITSDGLLASDGRIASDGFRASGVVTWQRVDGGAVLRQPDGYPTATSFSVGEPTIVIGHEDFGAGRVVGRLWLEVNDGRWLVADGPSPKPSVPFGLVRAGNELELYGYDPSGFNRPVQRWSVTFDESLLDNGGTVTDAVRWSLDTTLTDRSSETASVGGIGEWRGTPVIALSVVPVGESVGESIVLVGDHRVRLAATSEHSTGAVCVSGDTAFVFGSDDELRPASFSLDLETLMPQTLPIEDAVARKDSDVIEAADSEGEPERFRVTDCSVTSSGTVLVSGLAAGADTADFDGFLGEVDEGTIRPVDVPVGYKSSGNQGFFGVLDTPSGLILLGRDQARRDAPEFWLRHHTGEWSVAENPAGLAVPQVLEFLDWVAVDDRILVLAGGQAAGIYEASWAGLVEASAG